MKSSELSHTKITKADPDEPPPVFGTWRRFYGVVIANTLLVYLLLFLFSYFTGRL